MWTAFMSQVTSSSDALLAAFKWKFRFHKRQEMFRLVETLLALKVGLVPIGYLMLFKRVSQVLQFNKY